VRIELTKHFQPHFEIEDLEENAQTDGTIIIEVQKDYKQLRSMQNAHIQKSFSKL